MRILVVGGTGTVGRPTVKELARRGHDVLVLSRHPDSGNRDVRPICGDVTTGTGLAEAMVGVDQVSSGYYRAKVAQERALAAAAGAAGLRWTVLRATQFHEFAVQMIERLRRGPLVPVPVMAVQPSGSQARRHREVRGVLRELAAVRPRPGRLNGAGR